ncbi:MAG: ABC transporter ATP-binding protein, partial [Deltaproteobacteria bacterium]|nr:ABC transporter ATP-binding protein [Deltaproteobacteria bacterium]
MITYDAVTKIFGTGREAVTALDNVSFNIPDGEIVVFLGPSGCGKTTMLRLTNRLETITRGNILIGDLNIRDTDPVELRQRLGYVIQAIGLFPNKTIAENIATVPKLLGWDKQRISERIDELLEMTNLEPEMYRDRYPAELSGGQQQRVGVARGLAADPEILLMDEPFGAIDPINREQIQNEFLRLQAKLKKTIAFVSHDIHEAIKMGDRIALF